jgi:hypothetical protein
MTQLLRSPNLARNISSLIFKWNEEWTLRRKLLFWDKKEEVQGGRSTLDSEIAHNSFSVFRMKLSLITEFSSASPYPPH